MKTVSVWLKEKSIEFTEKPFLLDETHEITYAENFEKINMLIQSIATQDILPQDNIIFLGPNSIEAYQLYFAVISLKLVWIPIDYRLDIDILNSFFEKLKPALIIYDKKLIDLKIEKSQASNCCLEMNEIFDQLSEYPLKEAESLEKEVDFIISAYLTSGSTASAKIVQHGWHATLLHADATVKRYQFNSQSRLFNPRYLFHVSGAFALVTLMHCGGSIIIPPADSYQFSIEKRTLNWAELMMRTDATHVSFFPTEMRDYASLVEEQPRLIPPHLKRITTGGEEVDLIDLIKISRALTLNKTYYDYLWILYFYLGDGIWFANCKALYEYFYGPLVQVTQTYGATELICNAIANYPMSGPDTHGVGSALHTLHIETIDEEEMILPRDGKHIGRLRFYGSSIATGYLDNQSSELSSHYFMTNDLATIYPSGQITLFGRYENLIQLPDQKNKINPVVFEREIKKINGVNGVIIFKLHNRLHAAIKCDSGLEQEDIIKELKLNKCYSLITTISFWDAYPLTEGGKVSRKDLINTIQEEEKLIIALEKYELPSQPHKLKLCTLI